MANDTLHLHCRACDAEGPYVARLPALSDAHWDWLESFNPQAAAAFIQEHMGYGSPCHSPDGKPLIDLRGELPPR